MSQKDMESMLTEGARWAIKKGYGEITDLEHIEHRGTMQEAQPTMVSSRARARQKEEMGTLGSGNHYLEVQQIVEIYDVPAAQQFRLKKGEIVFSIHCGSRGLGHQVATEFLKTMLNAATAYGIILQDRELACAPINSSEGHAYLGAMRAAANCALANRQILTHLTRKVINVFFPNINIPILYDVSHNTCSIEEHTIDGRKKQLFVHRKGATRALGPGNPDLPPDLRKIGQPVLIGGTMGTASYILAGTAENETLSFSSACHGAGRQMSRTRAAKQWQGKNIIEKLKSKHILIRSRSYRGIAEEAPEAYKDVNAVVDLTERAHLARKVAKLIPLICVKG